jgi:hypothetical protein
MRIVILSTDGADRQRLYGAKAGIVKEDLGSQRWHEVSDM